MAITQPLLKALVKISRRVNEVENFCISAPGWLLFASKMCFQQTIKFFTMQNWHSPFYCSQYHGKGNFIRQNFEHLLNKSSFMNDL